MGGADHVLVSGFAGLVAGAMSMAAGEYVSVSSQPADLARERFLAAGSCVISAIVAVSLLGLAARPDPFGR